jgi:hypothetical protein
VLIITTTCLLYWLMLHLFRRKMFSAVWYDWKSWSNRKHFPLTRKPSLIFVKLFPFFKTVNYFPSLSFSFSNWWTTAGGCLLFLLPYEPNAKNYFQENHFFFLKNECWKYFPMENILRWNKWSKYQPTNHNIIQPYTHSDYIYSIKHIW